MDNDDVGCDEETAEELHSTLKLQKTDPLGETHASIFNVTPSTDKRIVRKSKS